MRFKKILVPIGGERVDEGAIRIACSLAKKSKATIYILYVIEIDRSLPLDAVVEAQTRKAEEMLERAARIAEEDEEYSVIETDLLQAREAGSAIVEEAVEHEADLVVMGFTYKQHFGEFNLGSTVPYVFKNAPCQVLVWREPLLPETAPGGEKRVEGARQT